MPNLIRRIAHWLALLLSPGTGTHRAGAPRHRAARHWTPRSAHRTLQATTPARLPLHHSPYCRHLPLDGAASRLVRPYLAVQEHAQEQECRRHRRLALVLAADFGIDLNQHIVGAEQRTVAA
ncbi:hypothetical protein LMJ38_02090 [Streptomyces sp. R1]|uniref:hypothetical protein n=1 Tax=Streptomyces sp. R1 TaxID=1509279 RepID=UPI001E4D59F6|nr:hypothetical protein [Streptomyces sp. R1]MCC8334732.1 hypothetical protein [Streptomyces sp. R1]